MSYYEHIKSQSKLYQVMVYGCISMIIFWMFMNLWGYDAILKYKLQSPKNIIETCVYYRGKSKSKYSSGYYINVDNHVYDTIRLDKEAFPSGLTWRDFYEDLKKNQSGCYKIKYVQLNFILAKKIFIYDYQK